MKSKNIKIKKVKIIDKKKELLFQWLSGITKNLSTDEQFAVELYFICGITFINNLIDKHNCSK